MKDVAPPGLTGTAAVSVLVEEEGTSEGIGVEKVNTCEDNKMFPTLSRRVCCDWW